MATKRKTNTTESTPKAKRRRALARARAMRPIADIEALKTETSRQCQAEFEERWGTPFFAQGGLADGALGAWIIERWHAIRANKALEDEARELYRSVRKKLERIETEIREWREQHAGAGRPLFGGDTAVNVLQVLESELRRWPPVTVLEEHIEAIDLGQPQRRDGRSALVAMVVSECRRPPMNLYNPDRPLTTRDIAVISLLCGAGPDGWTSYDRALKDGEEVTPAKVIEAEEVRIVRLVDTLGLGSPSQ